MMEYTAEGRGSNALQHVVFVVQYAREFSDEEFQAFDDAPKAWETDLPDRSKANSLIVASNPQRLELQGQQVGYLSYESKFDDGSTEFGLRLERSRIVFTVGKYTNWMEIWPKAERHLQQAMELVPEGNIIVSYASEYLDLFKAKGDYESFEANKILRRDSRLIPQHVFERRENFHFHTGYFEVFETPSENRVLTRINVDLRDSADDEVRDMSILLFHQLVPSRKSEEYNQQSHETFLARGLKNFKLLHDLDKKVLLELLNDDMAQRIKLLP